MDNFKTTMEKLSEKYESIKALGPLFTFTQINFRINPSNGLPLKVDEEEPNECVIDEEVADAEPDTDWVGHWNYVVTTTNKYQLSKEDWTWIPPPVLGNRRSRSVSRDVSTSSSVLSDIVSSGVNHDQIHFGSVGNTDVEDVVGKEYFMDIYKYYLQRYILFSKYNAGIKLDREGWFSATPECIAKHHASRCGEGFVVDCFTGVGGNAIWFAPKCSHVVAIDIDPIKVEYARHNATVYGVEDKIDFMTGDSFILAKDLKQVDTVFLSPPWGGPKYVKESTFDMITMLKPCDGEKLFNMAKQIAKRVVMFLPRNVDLGQLADLALSTSPPWQLEVEKNSINGNPKAITAYFTHHSLACDRQRS